LAALVVLLVLALFVLWVAGEPFLIEWRRRRIRSRPFPDAWREILRRRVPYFRRLPADLQLQLKRHIQVFVAEKALIGCNGLVVTDEMRITVAAQACLLILNRKTDYYPRLSQILLYPGAFVVNRLQSDGTGVLQDQRHVLSGESWAQGQVILSWEDALEGASIVGDGRNVVIHEFAHQLDQEKGHANGAPALAQREARERWARVLAGEFATLQVLAQSQQPSLFSHYGATNPAEFFAVASEVFFEQPQRVALEHPALYAELAGFYRINPLSW
jgi:Mlc titration factor MtfA (ptsG expression regulator)